MARGERGLSDSVQWAILVPVILLTVLGLIQVGIWMQGRSVASNAAIAGAEEAALLGSSSASAREVARKVADDGGLKDVRVDLEVRTTTVRTTVTGRVPSFFDLGLATVEEGATRPLERVTHP